jgi:hypothetical protein
MPHRRPQADSRADDAIEGDSMRRRMKSLLLGGALAALTLVPGSPAQGAPTGHSNGHSNVHAMKVYVAYADGIRGDPTIPSPWDGDPGVIFIGAGDVFDAGAIRIVNPSAQPLTVDDVWVAIGPTQYDLWGSFVVPGKGSAILTQTDGELFNFDTSEPVASETCDPTGDIPTIHITVGSRHPHTRTFLDTGQVLNTGGVDVARPLCGGLNEGHPWVRIHGRD